MKHDTVSRKLSLTEGAMKEEAKFLTFIHSDRCPLFERVSFLSTIFDKEIVEKEGNENVLTSLIEAYKRHYQSLAEYRRRKFKKVVKPNDKNH